MVALSGCMGRAAGLAGAGVETVFVSGSLPISFSRLSEISDAIFSVLTLGAGAGAGSVLSACQS